MKGIALVLILALSFLILAACAAGPNELVIAPHEFVSAV